MPAQLGRPIAIVGASVRAAAASAVRAGYEVRAADVFADADLARVAQATAVSPYPQGLHDWLRRLDPQPLAWMYTGALENHPDLVDALAAVCRLWGNGGDTLRRVRSPWQLADALQQAGLQFPETRPSADGLPCDGSWLAKTCRGASGSGVRPWRGQPAVPRTTELVYQRRVPGVACSAVFVAAQGTAELLGVVKQLVGEDWLGAAAFQYCGAIGPWPVGASAQAEIVRIGRELAARFELVGVFGVDLVVDGDAVWTIEVNPRYPASAEVLDRTLGTNVVASHIEACRERHFAKFAPKNAHAQEGKAIMFAKVPLTISASFVDWALALSQYSTGWPSISDIPRAHTQIPCGGPVATVFARGTNVEEIVAELKSRVAELEQRLYSHRLVGG